MVFSDFEAETKQAAVEQRVPGAAVAAVWKDSKGEVHRYTHSFGKENVAPDAKDMTLDSLLWIASCTKLVTAISCLQVVEKGLVTLDQPLSEILPEFKPPIPVVDFNDANELVMSSTDKPLTLRALLSHSSGLSYAHPWTSLYAWRQTLPESSPYHQSKVGKKDITIDYLHPLIFEPGAPGRWQYGPGIDWAGKVVERVNPEGLTLGQYMAKYVFAAVGIDDATFRPLHDPKFKDRVITRSLRHEDGSLTVDPMELYPHIEPVDDTGGGGLYSTARQHIKILESLLLDDGKLLPSHRVEELFTPQLPESPNLQKRLAENDDANAHTLETEIEGTDHVRWNFSLCGLSALNSVPARSEAGTGLWSGLLNCYWWVDRKRGTAGFYGSQIYPWGDVRAERLHARFQKAVFEAAAA
ncbi:beta-lactamase [Thozetella sp. PMI_491]|nr:beta-lactamase [Thozetella sp. PMI_491]